MSDLPAIVLNNAQIVDLNRNVSSYSVSPLAIDREAIQNMILNIIQTERGTYPFEPTFGINLERFIFSAGSEATIFQIESELQSALTQWLPYARIGPNGISVIRESTVSLLINIIAVIGTAEETFTFRVSA